MSARHWSSIVRASLASFAVIGCASTSGSSSPQPPPASADRDAQNCRDFMAAMAVDSTEAAEKDFDTPMRTQLPPPLLRAHYRSFVAHYGPLTSWRIVNRDQNFEKDRFTLELQFGTRTLDALVVFEPKTGQIAGLFFSQKAEGAPRPAEAPDPQVNEVDEVVGVSPLSLPARLTLPKEAGSKQLPAVVLIAGSGPSDHDETIHTWKPFRDLAFGLAHKGIAALRYDKRTFAHPELFDAKKATVEEEVIADAVAAVARLRAKPEIDPARVFIIGHSLGALLAPEVADRAGGIAGLVLLAPPGRPLPELILEQLRTPDAKPADIAALEARVRALPSLAKDESVLGAPASYWQDLERRDEMGIARKLGRPVLILRGSLDRNVLAVDQERWVKALSGQVQVENVTLPGLNHLFLSTAGSGPAESHISEEVGARIAAFIANVPARASTDATGRSANEHAQGSGPNAARPSQF